jgi:hypothetical protein
MYAYIHKVGLLPPIYLYTSLYIYIYDVSSIYPPNPVGLVIVSRCAVVPGGRRRGGRGSPSSTPHGGGELHQAVIPHQNVMRASCINIGPIGYENTCWWWTRQCGCHLSIFIPSKVEIHCLARSEMPAMAQDGTSIVTPNGADCDWGGEDPEIWHQWPEPGFPAGTTCSHFGSCCWMGPQKLI